MSVAAGPLTRKLSGRARAMFAEWTAAVLRQHAGEVGMDAAAQAHYRLRFDALQPRDRRRLKQATDRWLEEHPALPASDEDDRRDTPRQNRLATYSAPRNSRSRGAAPP